MNAFQKKLARNIHAVLNTTLSDAGLRKKSSYAFLPMGKCVRGHILYTFGSHLQAEKKKLEQWATVEFFHAFTLVHDDIEDGDILRRGAPALWKRFGVAHGINTGDAMFVALMREVMEISNANPKVSRAFFGACARVIEGQALDFDLRPGGSLKKKYIAMCKKKTGALFGFAFEAAALLANRSKTETEKYRNLGVAYGVLYQIVDDVSDMVTDAKKGKITLATQSDRKVCRHAVRHSLETYELYAQMCMLPLSLKKTLDKYVYQHTKMLESNDAMGD